MIDLSDESVAKEEGRRCKHSTGLSKKQRLWVVKELLNSAEWDKKYKVWVLKKQAVLRIPGTRCRFRVKKGWYREWHEWKWEPYRGSYQIQGRESTVEWFLGRLYVSGKAQENAIEEAMEWLVSN